MTFQPETETYTPDVPEKVPVVKTDTKEKDEKTTTRRGSAK